MKKILLFLLLAVPAFADDIKSANDFSLIQVNGTNNGQNPRYLAPAINSVWSFNASGVLVTKPISDFSTGGATWGMITGTLSAQTDLQASFDLKSNLASPTFTGVPAAPTAAPGTNTTQIASTAFVTNAIAGAGAVTSVVGQTGAVTGTQILADGTIAAALAAKQPLASLLTSWGGVNRATGFDTFTTTASSANLRALLSDEVGTGAAYFVGGALGTPASATLTNATGLPVGGVSAIGTPSSSTFLRGDGAWATPIALANWTEAVSIAAPNATTPVVSFSATNAATNVDAVIAPKGTGALLRVVPDSTATGGNKRGNNAVDLQKNRNAAIDVASGDSSTITGGYGNRTTGQYSVIGGGYRCTSSGDFNTIGGGNLNSTAASDSTVAGGFTNAASGQRSAIGGGGSNVATNQYSTVSGGFTNQGTGDYASAGGGSSNTASGQYSTVVGGLGASTRGLHGVAARSSGSFTTQGDAQIASYILRIQTTNATITEATLSGAAGASTNRIVLPNSYSYRFTGSAIGRNTSTGDTKTWAISGTIKRGANAAATAVVGTPAAVSTDADVGAAAWAITIDADTTNGSLRVQCTGAAATTVKWVIQIETVEVG